MLKSFDMKNVFILMPPKNVAWASPFQFWFADSLAQGLRLPVVKDWRLPEPIRKIRTLIGRTLSGLRVVRNPKKRIFVCASSRMESVSWPLYLFYEIIPVVWDMWPSKFKPLVRFIRRNKVRLAFITSSVNVDKLRTLCPGTKIVWLPEGIRADLYPMGAPLVDRPIDIINYGRPVKGLTQAIETFTGFARPLDFLRADKKAQAFKTMESLIKAIGTSKMALCYPRCMTHPEIAGDIETLTQRYWECMLSGTLPIGHAPKELVDLCGYNPVVELPVDAAEACRKIDEIVKNIANYQELADRNRQTAERLADWRSRMQIIKGALMS